MPARLSEAALAVLPDTDFDRKKSEPSKTFIAGKSCSSISSFNVITPSEPGLGLRNIEK